MLFKVHLSNIYRAINLDLPPYLQDLWTNPAVPDPAASGIIEPMIDGIALPGEWDGAARYDAPVSGGNFDIESFHFGYDASNVFIRVDAATLDELEDATGVGQYDSPDLAIYFMQPNAVNFNEAETNFRTYYGNQILGFPSKHMVAFDFDTLREDGRAKWNLFSAQGKVGDEERWVLSGSSNLGGCAVDEVYEFSVPWADIGLAPRYSTRVKVVTHGEIRCPTATAPMLRWRHLRRPKWSSPTLRNGSRCSSSTMRSGMKQAMATTSIRWPPTSIRPAAEVSGTQHTSQYARAPGTHNSFSPWTR